MAGDRDLPRYEARGDSSAQNLIKMQLLTLGQYRCAHDNSQKLTIGQQNSRWKNYLDIRPITVNFSFIVGHSHHKIIYQNAPWMLTIWLTTKTKNHWHVFVKKTFKKTEKQLDKNTT